MAFMKAKLTNATLLVMSLCFLGLCGLFLARERGPAALPPLALVDPVLIVPTTFRTSYVQLVSMKADLSDFECYTCHEKGKPPPLRFDTNQNIIVPQEHSNIVMAHGGHNRNNNCFNCHDEQNLERLQTRDGRPLKFSESPPLCGSCHGPTYRDWEGGAHGRTGGFWSKAGGERSRLICVDCHNPHSPKIPTRRPLPGPHPLRQTGSTVAETSH
jgi:hypothetical protein